MKKAFTLGEILVALVVIGIVAVLILPLIVYGQRAVKAQAQFNSAYSQISKIFTDMESDDLSINSVTYSSTPAKLYNTIKKYSRVAFDCGDNNDYENPKNAEICNVDNTYKTRINKSIKTAIFNNGGFVFKNGMLISTGDSSAGHGVLISVDINGKNNPPNRWGWDLFTFELINNDILPAGAPGTTDGSEENRKKFCSTTDTSDLNGLTCAYYALSDEKYFKNLFKGY